MILQWLKPSCNLQPPSQTLVIQSELKFVMKVTNTNQEETRANEYRSRGKF